MKTSRNIFWERFFERYFCRRKEDLETREIRETDSSKLIWIFEGFKVIAWDLKVKISRPDKVTVKSVNVIFRIKYFWGIFFEKVLSESLKSKVLKLKLNQSRIIESKRVTWVKLSTNDRTPRLFFSANQIAAFRWQRAT